MDRRKLSIEERAKRRATRIDNKRAKEAPLLAYAGLVETTTPREQEVELRQMDAEHAERVKAWEAKDVEFEAKAAQLRLEVQKLVTPEIFATLEAKAARPYMTGAYLSDHWGNTLRRLCMGYMSLQGADYGLSG